MSTHDDPNWPPEPLYVAVDVVVFTVLDARLQVLLWQRPYEPFEGRWGLIGTFSRPDETLEESPERALAVKAGIEDVYREQLATYDQPPRGRTPGRDPRGRVVSVAYLALLGPGGRGEVGGDDVAWWPAEDPPVPLAFDHERMLRDAVARLRAKTRYAPLAFRLLADRFTLPEAREVYEAILGEELDVRNFRRDLRSAGVIEATGGRRQQGPGRPARLYRYVSGSFAVDADERRIADRIDRTRPGEGERDPGPEGPAGS